MAVSDVPSPSAEIAINRPQVDASINGALIQASMRATVGNGAAILLSAHRATNTSAKTGIGILVAAVATARCANSQPMTRTRGNIKRTRNSLTITAVLPAVSDTAYPAPTTLRAIIMVAPGHTPVVCGSNLSQMQISG